MKTAYVMCGIPGSGKSTFVKRMLTSLSGAEVISSDDIIEQAAKEQGKTYNEVFSQEIDDANMKFFDRLVNTETEVIFVDRTHVSVKSRRRILDILKMRDYYIVGVFVSPPSNENAKAKWSQEMNNRIGKTIPEFIIKTMSVSWKEPSLEEGFDEVYPIVPWYER